MEQWKVDKDKLIKTLEILDLIPTRPGIGSSEFIRLEKKSKEHQRTVTLSLASEIAGFVEVIGKDKNVIWPISKSIFIDRRLFFSFIFAAKTFKKVSEFIFYGDKEGNLIVRHGRRKATFHKSSEVTGYGIPERLKSNAVLELDEETRGLINCAKDAATANVAVPELNCVYVKPGVEILSTTQELVFRAKPNIKLKLSESIPFPLFIVSLITNKSLKSIEWRKKEVLLNFPQGQIWESVSGPAIKEFPHYKIDELMDKSSKYPVAFKSTARNFGIVIERLGSYLSSINRVDWVLQITGKKGENELLMICELPQGIFKEKVVLKHSIQMDFDVSWPLDKMKDILGYIAANEREITIHLDKQGRAYMQTEHIEMLIPRLLKK